MRDGIRLSVETIPEALAGHRYAPEKWSVSEVLSHINDSERLNTMRAFWFARANESPLPSFHSGLAVKTARAADRPWSTHVHECLDQRVDSGRSPVVARLAARLPSHASLFHPFAEILLKADAVTTCCAPALLDHERPSAAGSKPLPLSKTDPAFGAYIDPAKRLVFSKLNHLAIGRGFAPEILL